jgi:broad specificity phosphatase PhoE
MPDVAKSYPDPADPELPEHEAAPRLVVVRHGTTAWSRTGRHTGRTDVPLEEQGRRQALEIGRRLAGHRFAKVLTSPLARAQETCRLAGFGEAAEICADLAEWDYGEYEGLTSVEVRARRPDWSLWRDGCPGGESAAQVGLRADRVIAELRTADGPAIVFSHGHLLRVLGARWIELDPAEGGRLGLAAGALSLLGHEHGLAILAGWNEATGTGAAHQG